MVDEDILRQWFCREVLPLERPLTYFIRRNWRTAEDVIDLRHDIYELTLEYAQHELPSNARATIFTIARNHLASRARRARIVSFDLVAELEGFDHVIDLEATDRHLSARDTLRRVQEGIEKLSPRVREIVQLRKIEGLDTRETAQRLGIGVDAVKQQLHMGMQALANFMLGGSGKIIRPRFERQQKRDEQ